MPTVTKVKTTYECQVCGGRAPKWAGQCADCSAWNTLELARVSESRPMARAGGYTGQNMVSPLPLATVALADALRASTGFSELDRVLGGGWVAGSVVLVGGDPGIGKSTLLLQVMSHLSATYPVLYVTGEESPQQVALRAHRLALSAAKVLLFPATQLEEICAHMEQFKPAVMVIDSIQTLYTENLPAAPGSVSQVRECAAQLVRLAKTLNIMVFLVGHVTKEGSLAGPRVLEHMVDTVLYFEGQEDARFRLLRAVKNRFGAVNELGIFAMTEKGLKPVTQPSAIFLSQNDTQGPGSVVMPTWEGTRPLLVEIQALVDQTPLANPRRVTVGLEQNRLAMLLAVLHRHGGIALFDQDVFVNAVGGVRIGEAASDLPVVLAVWSSFREKPIAKGWMVMGEVGLNGEIRPTPHGQDRLQEAAKHGFHHAIVPKANVPKKAIAGMEVIGVVTLQEALQVMQAS